jgi:hypothetical protein
VSASVPTRDGSATVHVLSVAEAIDVANDLVDELVETGKLSGANGTILRARLAAALRAYNRGRIVEAVANLAAVNLQLDVWALQGKISLADSAPLRQFIRRLIVAIT